MFMFHLKNILYKIQFNPTQEEAWTLPGLPGVNLSASQESLFAWLLGSWQRA